MEDTETTHELVRRIGAQDERLRILSELFKADLPVGVWPLIKDIISPEIAQQNNESKSTSE